MKYSLLSALVLHLFCVIQAKKRNDPSSCFAQSVPVLFDGIRAKFLTHMQRSENTHPVAAGHDFCGFGHVNCCSESSVVEARMNFLNFEMFLEDTQNRLEYFFDSPESLRLLLESDVSLLYGIEGTYSTEFNVALTNMAKRIVSEDWEQVGSLFLTLMNDLLGYFSSLSCSVCDPHSKSYLSLTPHAKYHTPRISLNVNDDYCVKIVDAYLQFGDALTKAVEGSKREITELAYTACQNGYEKDCSRVSVLDRLANKFFVFLDKDSFFEATCGAGGRKDCNKFICGSVLRGLAFDVSTANRTIHSFIKNHVSEQHREEVLDVLKLYKKWFDVDEWNTKSSAGHVEMNFTKTRNSYDVLKRKNGLFEKSFQDVKLFEHPRSHPRHQTRSGGKVFKIFLSIALIIFAFFGIKHIRSRRELDDSFDAGTYYSAI